MVKVISLVSLTGLLVLSVLCSGPVILHAEGVFRFPLYWVPTSLDPVKDELVSTYHVVQQVYDGLVAFDSNLRIVPGLAESWRVSRDGKEYVFTLRKGVRFHNSRELSPQDVVASLTRLLSPDSQTASRKFIYRIEGAQAYREGKAQKISGIRILAPDQVLIQLTEPYAAFLSVLAMPVMKIVPAELIDDPDNSLDKRPVGTGPFRFVSWEENAITLKANTSYFSGPTKLEGVRFSFYPGETRSQAFPDFLEGKLDGCPLPGTADPDELRRKGYQVLVRPRISLMFYGMNQRIPPLDNPLVRKALALAFDRETYAKKVLQSKHLPAYQIIPPRTPGYSPDNALLTYDPDRAAALLKESGHAGGDGIPELVIASVSHSDAAKRELEMFRQNLSRLGVKVKPLFIENWEVFKKGLEDGIYPLYRYALYADIPDPDDFFPDLVGTGTAHNFTGYSDTRVDDIIEKARTETDPIKRITLYREAEQIVLGAPPLIPVLFLSTQVAFQKNVENVELPATGTPYLPLHRITFAGSP